MAAIDKLYLKEYYEYDDLRKWVIAYRPQLLVYFFGAFITYNEWKTWKDSVVENKIKDFQREGGKIFNGSHIDPIDNLIEHYKKSADYDCPREQAEVEVQYIKENLEKNYDDIYDETSLPVASFPIKVDLWLAWRCPLRCIRKYLLDQCGVDRRWEKIRSLFWKGRKYFG